MKAVIVFLPCWAFYLLGDLVSKVLVRWDGAAGMLYPVYSWLIRESDDMQEWAGGVAPWFPFCWEPVGPDDDEAGGCLAPTCGGVPADPCENCPGSLKGG